MCQIGDGERAEFWSDTHRRARKQHTCDGCGGIIMPGTVYLINFTIYEGYPDSAKCCAACENVRDTFGKEHGNLYPHPGSLIETLEECIDEGDAESLTKWQPLLDELHSRRGVQLLGSAGTK